MPIRAISNNELTLGDYDDADYEIEDTSGFFSTHANLIPMSSAVQGPRVFYGAWFFEQALPLVQREAPLVRNLEKGSGRSWDHGRRGAGQDRRRGRQDYARRDPDQAVTLDSRRNTVRRRPLGLALKSLRGISAAACNHRAWLHSRIGSENRERE